MTDLMFFTCIFISVAVGWMIGISRGIIMGISHAEEQEKDEYPIANVYFDTVSEDVFTFTDMATGEFMIKGGFDDCINHVKSKNPSKLIVFSELGGDNGKSV